MLAALEGCIERYESLHARTGTLQSDNSIGNLMMNEDDDNRSWRAFLIDLDLAIKEQRDGSSGARGKADTRAFMAIGVLYGEQHFWVLFWICIHYSWFWRASVSKDISLKRMCLWEKYPSHPVIFSYHGSYQVTR